MTVTYTAEVATCRGLGCFWKLLFRWRGSIYKLLWPNLVVYSIVYFTLSGVYRFMLNEHEREYFEKVSLHCQAYGDLIPIAFVLGFYVSIVIKRWWEQYICMPWPDNLAMFVSTLVHGQDDRGRLMRRTIIRYVNLCLVITLRMMSPRVKKRFPTLDHLVEAGFMQPTEKKIFEDLDQKTTHPKYWMPLVWAGGIVTRARKEGRVKDDHATKTLIDELNTFRSGCGGMLNYDWISIPLVYTQVVTLAVYVYFVASLMGNQFLDPTKGYPKHEIDLVVPVFTFLQFFFYMGWLKVAESLVNPFGEDDDDFELNWLVDRNLQVSYVIVDEMHQEHPEMVKDQYWDEVFPVELPYTAASKQYQTGAPPVSTDNVEVSMEQAEFMPLMDPIVESDITDDRDELEADLELGGAGGEGARDPGRRRETNPVRIARRRKSKASASGGGGGGAGGASSVGSANTACSFSAPRNGRKSSVLNMLTRMFRREESSKDLGSQMGSSVSLTQRGRGLRSSSRMSSMSQSQAQSRTSIVRENTFQDEMFHMSDMSLAGSVNTASSQIQMNVQVPSVLVAPPTSHGPHTGEPTELSRLLTPATAIAVPQRKYSKAGLFQERQTPAAAADMRAYADDASDNESATSDTSAGGGGGRGGGGGGSDWHITDNPAAASTWSGQFHTTSPPPAQPVRLPDSFRHRPFVPTSRREQPLVSPVDSSCAMALVGESITRIITPSSPPVRHSFAPLPSLPPPPLLSPTAPGAAVAGGARRKRSTEGVRIVDARDFVAPPTPSEPPMFASTLAPTLMPTLMPMPGLARRASDPWEVSLAAATTAAAAAVPSGRERGGVSCLARSLRLQQMQVPSLQSTGGFFAAAPQQQWIQQPQPPLPPAQFTIPAVPPPTPATPATPATPTTTVTPATTAISAIPETTATTAVPAIPSTTSILDTPLIPATLSTQAIPPTPAFPTTPTIPPTQAFPTTPTIPPTPAIPTTPFTPVIPTTPFTPATPDTSTIPATVASPAITATSVTPTAAAPPATPAVPIAPGAFPSVEASDGDSRSFVSVLIPPSPPPAAPPPSAPALLSASSQLITIMPPASSGPRLPSTPSHSMLAPSHSFPSTLLPLAGSRADIALATVLTLEDALVEIVTTPPTPPPASSGAPAPAAPADGPETSPPPLDSIPPAPPAEVEPVSVAPYVPSPAIPVPAPSPAVAAAVSAVNSSHLDELLEVAMAPVSRRTLHDFHELEPISEHGEHSELGESFAGDGSPSSSQERLSVRYDEEAEMTAATSGTSGRTVATVVETENQPPPPPPPTEDGDARRHRDPGDGGGGGAGGAGGGGGAGREEVIRESTV